MLTSTAPRGLRRPVATAVTVAASIATIAVVAGTLTGCAPREPISTVDRISFTQPLPIPPLAPSTVDADGVRSFQLVAQEGSRTFRPGEPTATWGFNQDHLGPTIVAERTEHVRIAVTNALPETTTVHWHGMHLPARMDGGPHQTIAPGETWTPHWQIDQPAATLWYHPHLHGTTEEQVGRGLAGMVILRDTSERALALPRTYGLDDIPVIVQDANFTDSGQFIAGERGFAGQMGTTLLVNGAVGPFLEVTTRVVRLRLLNASPARVYNFGFDDGREFDLIGTDGGLLPAPHRSRDIQLSPGERAEIVVGMQASESAVLRSTRPDLGMGDDADGITDNGGNDSFDVLELRAAGVLDDRVGETPATLGAAAALPAPVRTRTFDLSGVSINDQSMQMDRVNETVTLGSTEQWIVRNSQDRPHSFHVHDVQFLIRTIDGNDPPPELAGWKDTIYLRPQTEYSLVMQFDDYADPSSPYMYHCHLLWHEDRGMMGQFVVVRPGDGAATIEGDNHDH
jgi:suppressor of ftsI